MPLKKLLLASFTLTLAHAETITLLAVRDGGVTTVQDTLTLDQGDTAKIISGSTKTSGSALALITIRGQQFSLLTDHYSGQNTKMERGYTIAGPAIIKPDTNGADGAFLTVEVTRANTTPTQAPTNSVVIPENAAGNVYVVMESSTDMITWTQANPGIYGGSTQRRFFRLRAVQQ
ncbi:hypothetical protein [Luteolibacter sp. LG18]|uniref:hypothetical protein n=1 Tax=Luteolibacter sp. LG18 TaxID=2819286 RepID=UPI002B321C3F|nr:hypothetical protein llg_42440 [Luteolibacter sp. LG18]